MIIVGTIAEDILTAGIGIADDAPSFAAAAVMFTGGMKMMKSISGGIPIQLENTHAAHNSL